MMKTFTKILLILCLTFLLAGCGDNSKKHIVFDYGSRSVSPETTPRLKIGLKGFTDARQMDNVVCKVFFKSSDPDSVWLVDTPIEKYLNEGLTAELASVGVETVPVADNIPTIEGKAVIFYGWTTRSTSSFNAAVNIEVSILTDKRLRFFQSYFAKKLGSKLDQECEWLLKDATAEVMGTAAADIRKFLIKEAAGE